MNHRNGGDVHGVARGRFVGANAALAEDHVVVSAGHDVLARQQQFLNRRGDAPLQQNGLARLTQLAQQVEVLHVARPHLETIHIGQHGLDLRDLHHLAER